MKYSKTTGCFYPEWGIYEDMPGDLIEATEEELTAVLNRAPNAVVDVVGGHVVTYILEPTLSAERERLKGIFKMQCQEHIYSVYPAPIQASAIMGLYGTDYLTDMTVFITSCIAEENRISDLLDDETEIVLLYNHNPVWPENA